MTMIPKLEKKSERKEHYRQFSVINTDAKFQHKISKLNQVVKKYIMPKQDVFQNCKNSLIQNIY